LWCYFINLTLTVAFALARREIELDPKSMLLPDAEILLQQNRHFCDIARVQTIQPE
jgi:hypothetical protein